MSTKIDLLIDNIHIASMTNNGQAYGTIENASVAIKDGLICSVAESPNKDFDADKVVDGNGQWLTPGLIDCHTHLVYAGNRATEFEMRQQGKSYAEIAQQGGGIQSTVNATRQATESELLESAIKRATRLAEEGVTCIEIKSGYGLDLETELSMLRVAAKLERYLPLSTVPTYLGAHTVPLEYKDNPDAYVEFVCNVVIPKVAEQGLARSVDVFCESIGFSPTQCQKVFESAKKHGLHIKAHVEQLSDLKGAKLAANFGAMSVDHIEYLAESDIQDLAEAGTVAVLLPGAFYFLRETQLPPVDALKKHKVPIAIATDLNPGSSPLASILTTMNMSCVLFGLTPEDALKGVTINAAKALKQCSKGQIATGYDADLCLWDIQHPSELSYGINQLRPSQKWVAGNEI